jgi:hypothetical protein
MLVMSLWLYLGSIVLLVGYMFDTVIGPLPRVLVFYIGDWDPSGIFVDRDVKNVLREEWKLKNFELVRIAVKGDQVNKLKLFKAKDPKTLQKLYRDSRHKEFMRLNNGELFQTEADAILKAAGLREIKRIIEEDIIKKYWDKKKWKQYENIFTVGKVQLRFVRAMGELTTELLGGNSEIEEGSIVKEIEEEEDKEYSILLF